MIRITRWLVAATLALAAFGAWAADAPDKLIERVSVQMIDRIKGDKALQSGDVNKMNEAVNETVMPHVNFERMTALSVGRNWRAASGEQKQQLMREFRTLLVHTYAGALSAVRDQSIKMKPFNGSGNEVIVRSEVVRPGGQPIQLDYRLEKSGEDWKIYDVNVLGVWLVETYRSQFAQEVGASGIDGLIKSLADKNKSFGSSGKS